MEMEGRGYSDFYRNTSEEVFIRTMMDSSIGMPAPTMEMLGFKNLNQNSRIDSEELFKNWLTNGENNGGFSHRNRQGSRRISAEASNLSNQQSGVPFQKKKSDEILFAQNTSMVGDSSIELNHHNSSNPVDKNLQATNMFLAKAWFHSSQPMTRSRSSELRRRYVASQIPHPAHTMMETLPDISENGILSSSSSFKLQEYNHHPHENGYNNNVVSVCEPTQMSTFLSPSNSSSSNFNAPQMGSTDNISSVVSMLKGTLERKKLNSLAEKDALEDSSFQYYGSEDALGQENHVYEMQGTFQDLSSIQQTDEMPYGIMGLGGMVNTANVMQMNTLSREASQSESSAAGPSTSGQAPSVCESSGKQVGNGRTSEYGSRVKDVRQRTNETGKDDRKKGGLVRYGSINSAGSGEQGDPTKKRRVERSRKMAEAKERNLTPVVPSDMQSILKRCENLEKEVRSLKLNLSFMNRKDSEQTKQIEELQKQNEDLSKEKERLLEEIERIISETTNM